MHEVHAILQVTLAVLILVINKQTGSSTSTPVVNRVITGHTVSSDVVGSPKVDNNLLLNNYNNVYTNNVHNLPMRSCRCTTTFCKYNRVNGSDPSDYGYILLQLLGQFSYTGTNRGLNLGYIDIQRI